jgi:hypothetical protein
MTDIDLRAPALSVILATAGGFPSIRTTFRHLQQQTVADRLEVIVLTPKVDNFDLSSVETACFHNFRLLKLDCVMPLASANAIGVRHASAPVVVLAEDHAFPEKGWAEALLARHQENWAVVGPIVKNGNPKTAISWAEYLLGYGSWHEGQPAGPAQMLPGHNSSYKRAVLLLNGENLADLLRAESVFHQMLIENGERLFLENRAVISHLNFTRPGHLLCVQFQNGRQYAACRRARWRWWKSALYFAAAPLIPVVRFVKLWRCGIRFPRHPSRLRIFLALAAGLVADGAGQAAGYLCGRGSSAALLMQYEYNRQEYF